MDDLLDLSWSSPASSTPKTASAPSSRPGSSFDLLSKPAGSGGPSYYSSAPLAPAPRTVTGGASSLLSAGSAPLRPSSSASLSASLGGSQAASKPTSSVQSRTASPAVSGGVSTTATSLDAFSDLLGSVGPTGANGKNLTIAERQAQLAAEKKAKEEREKQQWGDNGFWDRLESGTSSPAPPVSAPPKAAKASSTISDDLGILAPTPSVAKKASTPLSSSLRPSPSPPSRPDSSANATGKNAGSFWESEFLEPKKAPSPAPPVKPSTPSAPAAQAPVDPWDFDALASSSSKPANAPANTAAEDGFGFSDDEEGDLLGGFGRPARKPRSPKKDTGDSSISSPNRADSPPPHILGQIVEMGFSPAQARAALAATPTGLDVQAALESLLGENGGGREDDLEADDERVAREMQAREERRARHAARRAGPSRDAVHAASEWDRDRRDNRNGGSGGPSAPGGGAGGVDAYADQADRVLAQASEIGASVLSKATSFWNTSKERALKVYEEQRKALEAQQAASRRKPPTDGRPRWMVEAEEAQAAEAGEGARSSGFQDDEDPTPPRPAARKAPAPAPKSREEPRAQMSTKERADLLFTEEPKRYISPHRHAKGRGRASPAPAPAPAPAPPRAPAPLPTRELVPATPGQVQTAGSHKAKGNEHFKLGRFAEAEVAYSSAILSLPAGHVHLVVLHNNRAATRLKLGNHAEAVADCTAAIDIVGPSYHPSKEASLPADVDVKLGDALVKATVKRAQAYEMAEKWRNALEDWERVLGFDAALLGPGAGTTKTQASEGARRAKQMLSGDNGGSTSPRSGAGTAAPSARSTPKPRPAPSRPVDITKSAAVGELRKAALEAAKEDDERMALKDSVDARLESWRKGKETNLRALIASLDTVLWDDILAGGLKVGMHQLVTDKQVKIKYMKVIARLHPDKLTPGNTTVEQRMLANGVFGALSEAWQAFNA